MEYITKDKPKGIGNPNELDFNAKLHVQSKFKPPLAPYFIENELYKFRDMITELHSILPWIPNYNLDKIQRKILSSARKNFNIIYMNADKNQGLVAMDRNYYMEGQLKQHCLNTTNYTKLNAAQAFKK